MPQTPIQFRNLLQSYTKKNKIFTNVLILIADSFQPQRHEIAHSIISTISNNNYALICDFVVCLAERSEPYRNALRECGYDWEQHGRCGVRVKEVLENVRLVVPPEMLFYGLVGKDEYLEGSVLMVECCVGEIGGRMERGNEDVEVEHGVKRIKLRDDNVSDREGLRVGDREGLRAGDRGYDGRGSNRNGRISDRSSDRISERVTDRISERSSERVTDRPTSRPTGKPTDKSTDRSTNRSTDRFTNKPTVRHTDRSNDRTGASRDDNNHSTTSILDRSTHQNDRFSILYHRIQCRICALRFTDTDQGKTQYGMHIEEHNRRKRAEQHKDTISRTYFPNEDNWLSKKIELPVARQEEHKLFVSKKLVVCNLCNEKMDVEWDDDNDSWMVKDAVKLGDGNGYVHRECAF